MKKNTIQVFVTTAVLVTITAFVQSCTESKGNNAALPKANDPVPVKIMSLEKTLMSASITASGQITTDDETILSFKTSGVISKVYVREGESVKKGQLLAKLDPTEINAFVSQARLGLEKAQRDYDRAKNLYRDSVATLEQLQNVETGLNVAREQYQAAMFNRSHAEIHATTNGHVLRKFANDGQVVGIGDPIILTNGGGADGWILKAGVSDKQWAAVQLKDKGVVTVDAFPAKKFQAQVIRKSETSDPQTGAFTIELKVVTDGSKFASGMFGAVEIHSGAPQSSWSVPYEAVLDANGNEGFVFVTNDDKVATRQPVIIESFNGSTIRISNGLEDAKALVVSGSAYLKDQSPIIIIK
jgi:RND family efflux transporter MFP subunit